MVNDAISDSLIRIKNGYMASRTEVELTYSKLVLNLCTLLQKEGYIKSLEKQDERTLKVTLKYDGRSPSLTDVKRVSKPGLRVYKGVKQLPRVLNGLGIAVISTPKGLMTDKQAKKEGVGGEVMALVW
jgi:small subunit ribosomal protein S8